MNICLMMKRKRSIESIIYVLDFLACIIMCVKERSREFKQKLSYRGNQKMENNENVTHEINNLYRNQRVKIHDLRTKIT